MKIEHFTDHQALFAGIAEIAARRQDLAVELDARGVFPHDHIAALRGIGVLGLTAPVQHGGAGAGLVIATEVTGAIARSDPSTALVVAMHLINLATLDNGRWSADALARVLGSGAREGALINALRVEPDLGTPLRGGLPETIARATPDGWRLSGRKIYSTGSEALGWGIVWARTDENPARVGQFLVAMSSPGITITPDWDTLGLRSSASHDVIFDDVALPRDAAVDIRAPEEWLDRSDALTAWGTLTIAALYTGVAEAARDWTRGFLQTRVPANLGRPLASLPRQQEAFGRIETLIAVNRRLIRSAAFEVDAGQPPAANESAAIKLTATENAIDAVEQCMKLAGNHAIARRNPLERHCRDVLCGRIHSPQEDTILLQLGRASLEP